MSSRNNRKRRNARRNGNGGLGRTTQSKAERRQELVRQYRESRDANPDNDEEFAAFKERLRRGETSISEEDRRRLVDIYRSYSAQLEDFQDAARDLGEPVERIMRQHALSEAFPKHLEERPSYYEAMALLEITDEDDGVAIYATDEKLREEFNELSTLIQEFQRVEKDRLIAAQGYREYLESLSHEERHEVLARDEAEIENIPEAQLRALHVNYAKAKRRVAQWSNHFVASDSWGVSYDALARYLAISETFPPGEQRTTTLWDVAYRVMEEEDSEMDLTPEEIEQFTESGIMSQRHWEMTRRSLVEDPGPRGGMSAEEAAERNRAMREEPIIPAPQHICPRCEEPVPNRAHRGEYEGARSRTDNRTEICSQCGKDESWEQTGGHLFPQSYWPLKRSRIKGAATQNWEELRKHRAHPMMPYPGPKEIPQLRLHFLDRWIEDGPFHTMVTTRHSRITGEPLADLTASELIHNVMEQERLTLTDASLWWVNDDMMTLLTGTYRSIPPEKDGHPLRGYDLQFPANQPRGLVCFQTPWVTDDSDDPSEAVKIHAMSWCKIRTDAGMALRLMFYQYLDYAVGLSAKELRIAQNSGVLYDAYMEDPGRLRGGSWIFQGLTDWPLKARIDDFSDEYAYKQSPEGILAQGLSAEMTQEERQAMFTDRQFFVAFASLVNARITDLTNENLPRHVRKQAERAGHPINKKIDTVRLVRLRQRRKETEPRDPDAPKTNIEYSHRWMSSAHYGWRWIGPRTNQRRKWTFVSPSIKGPEDKPLIIKETVRIFVQ